MVTYEVVHYQDNKEYDKKDISAIFSSLVDAEEFARHLQTSYGATLHIVRHCADTILTFRAGNRVGCQ